jgi:hypothetical protein
VEDLSKKVFIRQRPNQQPGPCHRSLPQTVATDPNLEATSKTAIVLDPSTHNRPSHDLSPHSTTAQVCFLSLSLLFFVCLYVCLSFALNFVSLRFSSFNYIHLFSYTFGKLDAGRHCGSWTTLESEHSPTKSLEMARDNILLTYVVVDVLFVVTGALLIIFAINTQIEIAKPFTKDNVVKDLLLGMCPLNGRENSNVS